MVGVAAVAEHHRAEPQSADLAVVLPGCPRSRRARSNDRFRSWARLGVQCIGFIELMRDQDWSI
jgi:hypothetical protein